MANRRTFLQGTFFGSLSAMSASSSAQGSPMKEQWISVIDLDRCDGCQKLGTPACVLACRKKNQSRYPEPVKPLQPYWPQTKFEDFSNKRNQIDRLTPYNWLYVEKIKTAHRTVFAPRRCMHCFDAPCRKLCPFGAIDKSPQGAVGINPNVCFGGAKCRDVCPWEIPQRQAGVGLYLDVAPKLAGGGVMYKCDFCADLIAQGEQPACAQVCPHQAIIFAPLSVIKKQIDQIAKDRFIYGRHENGGTATWYISSIDFNQLLQAEGGARPKGQVLGRPVFQSVEPKLSLSSDWAKATLAAPIVALGSAYVLRKRKKNSSTTPQHNKEVR